MPALDQFRLEPPSPASTPTLSEPPTFTDFVGADSCRNALALLFHEQVCYVAICQNNETRLFFPCGNSSFSGMSTDGLVSHSLPHHRFCPTAVSSSFRSPHPLPSPFSASFPFQPMIIDPEKERREKWKTAAADADAIYGYCKLRAKAPRRSTNSTVVQSPPPYLCKQCEM